METKELIEKFEKHHAVVTKMLEDANKEAKSTDARLSEIEQKMVTRSGRGAGDFGATKSLGQSVIASDRRQSPSGFFLVLLFIGRHPWRENRSRLRSI